MARKRRTSCGSPSVPERKRQRAMSSTPEPQKQLSELSTLEKEDTAYSSDSSHTLRGDESEDECESAIEWNGISEDDAETNGSDKDPDHSDTASHASDSEEDVYIVDFGKYKDMYRTLADVEQMDPTYWNWINSPSFQPHAPAKVKNAIAAYNATKLSTQSATSTPRRREQPRPGWTPPDLHDLFIRDKFFTSKDPGLLWITEISALAHFSLSLLDLANLNPVRRPCYPGPLRQPVTRGDGQPEYWLHHVWALSKELWSERVADEALEKFQGRVGEQRLDVYEEVASMFQEPSGEIYQPWVRLLALSRI